MSVLVASAEEDDRFLTAKEVARMLGISLRTLWRLKSARKFPSPVRIGGSPRWRKSVLLRWIEAGCPTLTDDGEWQRKGAG
jgi:excisionase family DNA binding protein